MENQQDLQTILSTMENYEAACQKKKKKNRMVFIIIWAICIPLYLYLRLFNTQLEYSDDSVKVKYSTAWYINISAEHNGNVVKMLGQDDLNDCAPNVHYIYVGDGITYIDELPSDTLWGIRIPNTIKDISWRAFAENYFLRWVHFPEQVQELTIGQSAFSGTAIRQLILPEGTSYIGDFAFSTCIDLKHVEIPDSVKFANYGVFSHCPKLETIKLSSQMEDIAPYFFSNCENLNKVIWPANLRSLSTDALEGTPLDQLDPSELKLPDSVYYARTSRGIYFDADKENEYLAEESGIPLEVLQHATESNDMWINGKWYTFPMFYHTFMEQDDWIANTSDDSSATVTVKHKDENIELEFYLKNSVIYKCKSSSSNCVFPGGYICNESKLYRGIANNPFCATYENHFEYTYGDKEQYRIEGYGNPNDTIETLVYWVKR